MIEEEYEVIVIGGGIYGAAVFWEAVSRGAKTLLLEKDDFGGATSANSLKTVHGGLRHIQSLNIPAVRVSSRERRILAKIAPHLVTPLACLMPTDTSLSRNRWVMGLGLKLYEMMVWDKNMHLDPARHYGPSHILGRSLASTVLGDAVGDFTGAACWYDGQVQHPERLVFSFVKSAMDKGGHAENYAPVKHIETNNNRISAVEAVIGGKTKRIKARVVVDCTGPWLVDKTSPISEWKPSKPQRFARSVNLIVQRYIADYAVGLRAHDPEQGGRLFFLAPWRGATLVGTWYLEDSGAPDETPLADAEIDAMIKDINTVMPAMQFKREDISLIHFGRLPLKGKAGLRLESKPRILHAFTQGGPVGLFFVQGVKLTTARQVAEKVVNKVSDELHRTLEDSISHKATLYGSDIRSVEYALDERLGQYMGRYGEGTLMRLFGLYGSCMDPILLMAEDKPEWAEPIPGVQDSLIAELHYVIKNEMVETLSDLILRRTDMGTLAIPHDTTLTFCAEVLGEYRQWGEAEKRKQIEQVKSHYHHWTRKETVLPVTA